MKTCVAVTPERIFWTALDNKNETTVLAARLREVEVRDLSSELIEDSGLEIFGLIGEFPERASAFIGLGEEEAAQALRRVLKKAAENAGRR